MAHMEPHPAREWIQMTPMDIITDDGSYGTTPSQGMDPDDTNGHRECGSVVLLLRYSLYMMSHMTAHMEPHPAREWIQMTPMADIVDVEFCFIALLLTVHVSSRSQMTAHMEPHPAREWIQMTQLDIMMAHMEPHPAREWIQMTPMDIVDDGSYGTTPSQGMDPDDINGHH
eukprot:scaffold145389_cov36-Attheya_sp.AAC.1